jgi:elongation factor Ts
MSIISASSVKELREKTGAGMMDCKKALTETQGNFEEAVDWLRKKGLSSAAKKSGRVAAEGLVAAAVNANSGVLLELNSETDFVARNDKFQALIQQVTKIALNANTTDVEELKVLPYQLSDRNIEQEIAENIAIIGENLNLRRITKLKVTNGLVASYMHNAVIPEAGKIGVLVALESTAPHAELATLGRQLAMHVAASKPMFLSTTDVDQEMLNREINIFSEQAKASGKPAAVLEKMVEGRVKKYYEEVVFLEQPFVIDGKTKISDLLAQTSAKLNAKIKISAFAFFVLGDGIEQKVTNFAEEVASLR